METTTRPDIQCQKCGTTVPWGPYCPHCQAYLEFAGIPPWEPEPPAEPEVPDADAVAEPAVPAAPEPLDAGQVHDALTAAIDSVVDSAVEVVVHPDAPQAETELVEVAAEPVVIPPIAVEPEPPVTPAPKPESGLHRWGRGLRLMRARQVIGYLAAIGVGLLLTALFGFLGGWATAWFVAPFLIIWGLISIGLFGTLPDVEHADAEAAEAARIAAEEEAARIAAEEEAARIAAEEEAARLAAEAEVQESEVFRELVGEDTLSADEMGARPPQAVERTAKVAKVRTAGGDQQRDIACLSCGRLNLVSHRLCEYCGASMEGAVVKPPVMAVLEARQLEEETKPKKKREQRRVSKSWRAPVAIVAVVGVIVAAFAFAFFGPGAFQFRFGTTRVYQLVARWINPYLGETVSVASVSATSNLPGADATQAGFGDARTFWASQPTQGYGVGTTITYTFAGPSDIDRMVIFPGIQSGQFDIRALATPKDITLTFDDGSSVKTQLVAIESTQQQRQLFPFDPVVTTNVKLTIDSVYPPRGKPADGVGSVAVSGTEFLQTPQAPSLFGAQNGPIAPKLPGAGGGGAASAPAVPQG